MGIPAYFANLIRAYPHIVRPRAAVGPVSRLYLDWNSAIHPCAAKVPDGDERRMIAETMAYLATLRRVAAPSRLTYVAIDGVPVFAKMQQQRRRRHLSVMLKRLTAGSGAAGGAWDSNAISPGTRFMRDLAAELRAQHGADATVAVSDDTEYGEGEHKIMQHLRDDPPGEPEAGGEEGATLIYGLDADLILLSMLSSTRRIFLMREPTQFRGEERNSPQDFLYLDVDALREAVRRSGVDDLPSYVVAVSLLGNDFLPPVGPFRMRRDGMAQVLGCYAAARAASGEARLVSGDGVVSGRFLKALLEAMAAREPAAMHALHAWYVAAAPPNRPGVVLQEFFPILPENRVVYPLFDGGRDWRAAYRKFLLPGAATPAEAAACYLQGLQWNLDYYTKGYRAVDARRWHYPYLYGPLAADLAAAAPAGPLPAHRPAACDLVPYTPVQCLALILPAASAGLLPERVRGIVTDARRGCAHAFPARFAMSTYLRGFLHETVPLLPHMDVGAVVAAVGAEGTEGTEK